MPRVSRAAMFTLYFIVFVDFFQLTFVFPLLPKIVQSFGKGAEAIGLLGSVAAAGEGIAAPYLGMLADKIGRRPVFLLAMLGCMTSSIVIGFANSYYFLLGAQFFSGICGGTAGVAGAYIADVTTPEERSTYMTYFQAALFSGLSVGPVVGGWMNHVGGWQSACFASAGVCALNVLSLWFLPDSRAVVPGAESLTDNAQPTGGEVAETSAAAEPPSRLPMVAYVIGVASFLNGIGFTAFEALGVLYLQQEFFDDQPDPATLFWSTVISGVGVVGLIVNLFLYAPIQNRIGLKGTILLGGATVSVSFVCIGFALSKWWFFSWVQVLVFGDNIMGTSIQTIITLVVHPSQFGKAIGMMTFFQNVARAFGPFAFAPVYEHVSHSAPWLINAVCKVISFSMCLAVPLAVNAAQMTQQEGAQSRAAVDPECPAEASAAEGAAPPERPVPSPDVLSKALTRQTSLSFCAPGGTGAALGTAMGRQVSTPARSARAPGLPRQASWSPKRARGAGRPERPEEVLTRARSAA